MISTWEKVELSNTTHYRVREGAHGEWVIDIGFIEFTCTGHIGRAATREDAQSIVNELNTLNTLREVFNANNERAPKQ